MNVWQQRLLALLIAGTIYAVMDAAVRDTQPWGEEGAGGAEDFETLADGLFDDHVLALEVLGILLTAAMIGAMVIARPLEGRPDTTNYPTKRSREDLDDIQDISGVDRNLGEGTFPRAAVAAPLLGGEEE